MQWEQPLRIWSCRRVWRELQQTLHNCQVAAAAGKVERGEAEEGGGSHCGWRELQQALHNR